MEFTMPNKEDITPISHFTVMDGNEGEGDLVLIQTFFALLWKLFLKNTGFDPWV